MAERNTRHPQFNPPTAPRALRKMSDMDHGSAFSRGLPADVYSPKSAASAHRVTPEQVFKKVQYRPSITISISDFARSAGDILEGEAAFATPEQIRGILTALAETVEQIHYTWDGFQCGRRIWNHLLHTVHDNDLTGQVVPAPTTLKDLAPQVLDHAIKTLILWKSVSMTGVIHAHTLLRIRKDYIQEVYNSLRALFLRDASDKELVIERPEESYFQARDERLFTNGTRAPISSIDKLQPTDGECGLFSWAHQLLNDLNERACGINKSNRWIEDLRPCCTLEELANTARRLSEATGAVPILVMTPLAPFQSSYINLVYCLFVTYDLEHASVLKQNKRCCLLYTKKEQGFKQDQESLDAELNREAVFSHKSNMGKNKPKKSAGLRQLQHTLDNQFRQMFGPTFPPL
ncbi:hypothetical protein T439DRAFT_330046 [Meredithblackwellia eburnea MCA 4105]